MTPLGKYIKECREKMNLSLQDVADIAGMSKAHVWDMETGKSWNPSIQTILGLAIALETNPMKMASVAFMSIPGVRTAQND